jgi:Putative adhesin
MPAMLALLTRFITRRTALAALTTVVAGSLGLTSVAAAQQRSDRDFSWDGRITSGKWLYVRDLNGSIRVERATGDRAEVTAVKRSRRGNPEDVRIETRRIGGDDGDVIICAFWTENASCDEDGYRSHGDNNRRNHDNDTSVEFTVKLPAGVRLNVSTVNGGVTVAGATSEVRASTVNGRVSAASSGGPVNASTVNGDIDVRMRELGTGDLEYSTVNGSIEIEVPANLDADLDMRTVNGSLSADFPITLQGRVNPRRMRATIGKGGRRIRLETVNGSVELRKAS